MFKRSGNYFLALGILIFFLMTLSPLASSRALSNGLPRLLICPRVNPEDVDSWPRVLNSLYAYKFYIDKLDPAVYPEMPGLVQTLVDHDVKIAIEMAGLVDWPPCGDNKAAQSFATEQPKLQHLLDMGGSIDLLVFDGPVSRTAEGGRPGNCEMEFNQVIRELVEVFGLYREWLPEVQIGLLVNFPHWEYGDWPAYNGDYDLTNYGDYQEVLATILAAMDEAGNQIAFVQVDNPYDYATGIHPPAYGSTIDPSDYDWIARLMELEAQIEAHPGTEMCMIYNSEIGGHTSDQLFYEQSLAFSALYPESGGSPMQLMFQSWYDFPTQTTPENIDYTFMNIPWVWLGSYPAGTSGGTPPGAHLSNCRGVPNPFNPKTEIRFTLSEPSRVQVRIFDMAGRLVATLHEGAFSAGEHRLEWKGRNDAGVVQAGGLYLCRVEADGQPVSLKIMMLK